ARAAGATRGTLAELGTGGRGKLGHHGSWVGRSDCGGSASTRGAGRTRASASATSITDRLAVQRPSPRQPRHSTRPTAGHLSGGSALEERGDRAVVEDLADRPRDERGDREHRELLEALVLRDRQGV